MGLKVIFSKQLGFCTCTDDFNVCSLLLLLLLLLLLHVLILIQRHRLMGGKVYFSKQLPIMPL
jgi:hypothetical protein